MIRLFLVCWMGFLGIGGALAAPVTYNFVGTLTYNDWPAGTFPYAAGDKLALSFTLQTDYPDTDPSPSRGEYYNPTGIHDIGPVLAVDIGGTGGFAIHQYLDVFNDYQDSDGNIYDWIRFSVGEPQRGWQSSFTFRTTDLSVLSSDEIPTFIDPDQFEETIFARPTRPFNVASGTIDEVVAIVPEPTTAILLGSVLMLIAGWRLTQEARS